MEESDRYFDLFFEGTSLRRSIESLNTPSNSLIFDNAASYGTTISFKDIRDCNLVSDVEIATPTDDDVLIETAFDVLTPLPSVVPPVECVQVRLHDYVDSSGRIYRIPYTKQEIMQCDFGTLTDKTYVKMGFEGKLSPVSLLSGLSPEFLRVLLSGTGDIGLYISNYQLGPFRYPVYGYREISEQVSRMNALRGVGYLIGCKISVEELGGEYPFVIRSKFGDLFARKYNKLRRVPGKFVRVFMSSETGEKEGPFYKIIDTHSGRIVSIRINSDARVCPEGKSLTYVLKEDSAVTDDEAKMMNVNPSSVELDVSFRSFIEVYSPRIEPDVCQN